MNGPYTITEPLVLVVGDGGVGISTLLNALEPDLTENVAQKMAYKSRTRNVYTELSREHMRWSTTIERQLIMRKADAFVLAFALDRADTFDSLEAYLAEVREEGRPNLPVFVAGLRADCTRAVAQQEIDVFCHKYGLTYAECNALSGEVSALRELVKNVAVCRDRAQPISAVRQRVPALEVEPLPQPEPYVTVTMMPPAKRKAKPCLLL